jgi:hypothetical protein
MLHTHRCRVRPPAQGIQERQQIGKTGESDLHFTVAARSGSQRERMVEGLMLVQHSVQ